MLLKFFKQTLPQVIIALILLAFLLWFKTLISDNTYSYYFDSIKMPVYAFVTSWAPENSIYSKVLTFLVMIFTAFYLLSINSKHIVIKQRTYLPAFFYILLVSCFVPLQRINPAVFSGFFILFAIDHVLSIYHKDNALDNIFRAGFFIGLASLFYAPSILYLFALLLSILSIRTFNIREWFASLFGAMAPWFFFYLYEFVVVGDLTLVHKSANINLLTPVNQDNEGVLVFVFYAYCLILFVATGYYLLNTLPTQKISVRKFHGVFFWINLVSVSIFVFVPTVSFELTYIAALPLTFQFAHYFTTSKRRFWPEFLFFLLIVIAGLMQFY
jgi:hypothetical protein